MKLTESLTQIKIPESSWEKRSLFCGILSKWALLKGQHFSQSNWLFKIKTILLLELIKRLRKILTQGSQFESCSQSSYVENLGQSIEADFWPWWFVRFWKKENIVMGEKVLSRSYLLLLVCPLFCFLTLFLVMFQTVFWCRTYLSWSAEWFYIWLGLV